MSDIAARVTTALSADDLRGTQLIFRRGNTQDITDLARVSAGAAAAVIVLSTNEGDADASDAKVLRTVLALKGLPAHAPLRGFIVAEIIDVDNREIVEIIGGEDIEVIQSHDICGRLMLLAVRHPGLAEVYDCLFGFQVMMMVCPHLCHRRVIAV